MNYQLVNGEKKSQSRWKDWLMPNARNLHPWTRIVAGMLENVALAFFLAPGIGIISNLENKYYERINLPWQWTASLGSLIAIMALLPVLFFSQTRIHRWLALVLIALPSCIALGQWFQWLDFLVSHGLELR